MGGSNFSGNLALAGTGHLTENNIGCLGYLLCNESLSPKTPNQLDLTMGVLVNIVGYLFVMVFR